MNENYFADLSLLNDHSAVKEKNNIKHTFEETYFPLQQNKLFGFSYVAIQSHIHISADQSLINNVFNRLQIILRVYH